MHNFLSHSLLLPLVLCGIGLIGVHSAPLQYIEDEETGEFCDEHNCPQYESVVSEEEKGYEMRCYYEKSDWLGTNITGTDSCKLT